MDKFFNQLNKSGYKVFGPKLQDGETHILELEKMPEPELLKEQAGRPFKFFLLPIRETLYKYEGNKMRVPVQDRTKKALFGMSVFDLKALELYDTVFANDSYYQHKRKNILIVGYSAESVKNIKTLFFDTDKLLQNIVFDIFIENNKFYAQTKEGEKILKSAGLEFRIVKYNPRETDKQVLKIKEALEKSKDDKLWDELGKICLACGKCSIACATCYCFDLESHIGPDKKTDRISGNCFFDDFTRIAGGHKFLNNPKEKIFFWYYHKFVRVPHELGIPGCTGCLRCNEVCPVGIDIEKNIKRLLKGNVGSKNKSRSRK